MRRIFAAALAATVLCGVSWAQTEVRIVNETQSATLLSTWNLNGIAAGSADQIVNAATLADSTTFTIAGQPDQCRLINMTVVDGDSSITAGTVTVTGTDCLGYARVCTFDFSVVATRGSGAKVIPVTTGSGSSCYLKTVTSVVSSALTGEGGAGDTLKVGYAANSAYAWAEYGVLVNQGPAGEHGVNPFNWIAEGLTVTTSGASSTTLTSVASNGAFTNVVVGDLLSLSMNGVGYEVTVSARASANSVTISKALKVPASGAVMRYKHLYVSSDPTDQVWIPVQGWRSAALTWSIDANADTGGVITSFQGLPVQMGPGFPTAQWVELGPGDVNCTIATPTCTVTTASGSAQTPYTKSVDLTLAPLSYLRVGWKFGTGDDADVAPESINATITLSR